MWATSLGESISYVQIKRGRNSKPATAFGTKASTLKALEGRLKSAVLLPQYTFTVKQWVCSQNKIVSNLDDLGFFDMQLAVRSSAAHEDLHGGMHAGAFLTLLSIEGRNAFIAAADSVIASFNAGSEDDEVLVQPMLNDVKMSGVVFTSEPNSGGDYFVVNYSSGRDTSLVTGGGKGDVKTYYCHHSNVSPAAEIEAVIELCRELDVIFNGRKLDIEFAVRDNDDLVLLQVRALNIPVKPSHGELNQLLIHINDQIKDARKPGAGILGDTSLFSVMTDWNPAEMIGLQPRPMAFDIYTELITNQVWAQQRYAYGYRDLRGIRLIHKFGNQPFVDIRASLNSFIPRELCDELAEKLVSRYIDLIVENAELHDKVEFEVALTCYTADFDKLAKSRLGDDFSDIDIQTIGAALKKITEPCLFNQSRIREEEGKINHLVSLSAEIVASALSPQHKVRQLFNAVRNFGTLPFAGLARIDFMANDYMKSLVRIGVLTLAQLDKIKASAPCIGRQMVTDLSSMEQRHFLEKYGHLRPGTYDITCARYDSDPDLYFSSNKVSSYVPEPDACLDVQQFEPLTKHLHSLGHNMTGASFIASMQKAMFARDKAKFVFSRTISDALKILASEISLGEQTRSLLSFCRLSDLERSSEWINCNLQIREASIEAQRRHNLFSSIVLPPVIEEEFDITSFYLPTTQPNFITKKRVIGRVEFGDAGKVLQGSVVFIRNADPGYDWIFTHDIAGFVTAYGGVNSHMALRAHALGIPAVIGAGETNYADWSKSDTIELNCESKCVRVILN